LASEAAHKNYRGTDDKNRNEAALEAGRMKRIKAIKLELEAFANENRILWKLQGDLKKEFGKDLWDKAMNMKRSLKSIEDLYFWYKKQVKEQTTKSEMDIQLKRANTKGLDRLF
jgi:hypothetical protein